MLHGELYRRHQLGCVRGERRGVLGGGDAAPGEHNSLRQLLHHLGVPRCNDALAFGLHGRRKPRLRTGCDQDRDGALSGIAEIAGIAEDLIANLETRIGLARDEAVYSSVVTESCGVSWTRDPFDRLIVGAALVGQHPLLTRGLEIRRNCHLASWDDSDGTDS